MIGIFPFFCLLVPSMLFTQGISYKIFDLWCVFTVKFLSSQIYIGLPSGKRKENALSIPMAFGLVAYLSVSVPFSGKRKGSSQKLSPSVKSAHLAFWSGF